MRQVRSELPDQRSNLFPLCWKGKFKPLEQQEIPLFSLEKKETLTSATAHVHLKDTAKRMSPPQEDKYA